MEQLRQNLVKLVQESGLPFEAVYYLVKDFYRDLEVEYKQYLAYLEKQAATEAKDGSTEVPAESEE